MPNQKLLGTKLSNKISGYAHENQVSFNSFGSLAIFATQLSTGCQQPIENIGSKKNAEESLLNTKEIVFDLQNIDIFMEKSEDGKLRIEENIDRNQATYESRQQGLFYYGPVSGKVCRS